MIDKAGTHNPVHESPTGGRKEVKAEQYSLIPAEPLRQLAVLYGIGAEKYGAYNWTKGYSWSKSYDSLQRHANQFWSGEDIDPETGMPHVIAVAFHAFALAQFMIDHQQFDDRPSTLRRGNYIDSWDFDYEEYDPKSNKWITISRNARNNG